MPFMYPKSLPFSLGKIWLTDSISVQWSVSQWLTPLLTWQTTHIWLDSTGWPQTALSEFLWTSFEDWRQYPCVQGHRVVVGLSEKHCAKCLPFAGTGEHWISDSPLGRRSKRDSHSLGLLAPFVQCQPSPLSNSSTQQRAVLLTLPVQNTKVPAPRSQLNHFLALTFLDEGMVLPSAGAWGRNFTLTFG
jgi:hypothetical protein